MILSNRIRKIYERRLLAFLYGLENRVKCPYCGWQGLKFLPYGAEHTPNRLCPQCGSLQRYRMLLLYLQQINTLQQSLRLLDMAPKNCFRAYIQKMGNVTYISTDLNSPSGMVRSDLTRMGMSSNSFDLIISLHVLEHIRDDRAAFHELARLLTPTGFGLLMVPINGEKTFEDPNAKPEEYANLYGQFDHVRSYGLDIATRMQFAGLQVEILDMFELLGQRICQRYAIYGDDRYFFKFYRE